VKWKLKMAKPHNKVLRGKESGGASQHWYDYIESKRVILRSKRWDGGTPQSKPGVSIFIWLGFQDGKEKWGGIG
jgi:hypothetical protein